MSKISNQFVVECRKAGLARFVVAEKIYVITPLGETWLTELEIHGLIDLGRAAA